MLKRVLSRQLSLVLLLWLGVFRLPLPTTYHVSPADAAGKVLYVV
jgi:hypothetical protein